MQDAPVGVKTGKQVADGFILASVFLHLLVGGLRALARSLLDSAQFVFVRFEHFEMCQNDRGQFLADVIEAGMVAGGVPVLIAISGTSGI